MKKLIGLLAALTLASPVSAEITPDRYKSYHSLGCMLLRECTDGVTTVTSTEDIQAYFPEQDYNSIRQELDALFSSLNQNNIEVFVADEKYFPRLHRGVYSTENNKFFLNASYMYDPSVLISVVRHEGWHAAQDCMAGSLDNTSIAIIHQDGYIPQSYTMRADIAYNGGRVVPWEAEAMWASETPMVTANALSVCASNTPMWERYEPTPLTRQWLVEEGFIK